MAADSASGTAGPDFPNDFGPAQVDVARYPKNIQADYKVFARRCAQCHTLARPINSQNLQLTPEEQKAVRETDPEVLNNSMVWRVSNIAWTGYVGRMYTKPGAAFRLRPDEFDAIIEFLVYDSKARKMGANLVAWRTQRENLLEDFKKTHPKRYSELFGQ